jgi:hypothetical protein
LIGFNELGNKGWLGNQMFQYAALRGIANKNGYDFCIPPNDETRIHHYGLFNIFEMSGCKNTGYIHDKTISVDTFEFNEDLYNNCPDNVSINGFFQTEKYFCEIKNEIKKDFQFNKTFPKPFNEYIALHVRRGDYLNHQNHHPTLDVSYYKNAISLISHDLPIVVFSDDIVWCKNNLPFADYFSEVGTRSEDLYLMTKATHNIIANSSFSWWGAWLNDNYNKIVVAPKKWFGPAYDHYNLSDLCPDDWTML